MAEEKRKRGYRGCLLAALGVAAVPVLLVAGYVIWGLWANARAEREANAVCDAIRVGDPVARLQDLAKGPHKPNRFIEHGEGYHFLYYGMIYSARVCRVDIANGRVASKKIVAYDD